MSIDIPATATGSVRTIRTPHRWTLLWGAWVKWAWRNSRTTILARLTALTAAVAMIAAARQLDSTIGTLALLGGVSIGMIAWQLARPEPGRPYLYALMGEAGFVVVLTTLGPLAASPYAICFCVMPLLAGVRSGIFPTLAVMGAEVAVFAGILVQHHSDASLLVATFGPVLVMAVGFGALGSWVRQVSSHRRDGAPYAAAHRLLSELRAISRRLPSGLDARTIARGMAADAAVALAGSRAALLVQAPGDDGLHLVASCGDAGFGPDLTHDDAVAVALQTGRPVKRRIATGHALQRVRTGLPLLIGGRCIGVAVVDGPAAPGDPELVVAQDALADDCLQLESAILFDDIRSGAVIAERHRLAREIHDGVAQDISSLGYMVDDLAHGESNRKDSLALDQLRREITRIVGELRMSIHDLHSDVTSDAGLGTVLSEHVQDVARHGGLKVHLTLEESDERLGLDVEIELLRIAQEAMANARKHSGAQNLWVTCRLAPPCAELRVEDDGVGGSAARKGHYGLRVMQERADRINAELTIADRPGGGTIVAAVLASTTDRIDARMTSAGNSNIGGDRAQYRLAR